LGLALLKTRSYDDAIESFKRALELNPNELLIYNDLADAYDRTNRRQEAVNALRHAFELANARGDRPLIGNFRMRLKVVQNPTDAEAQKTLGFAMAKAGHFSDAAEKFQAALAAK